MPTINIFSEFFTFNFHCISSELSSKQKNVVVANGQPATSTAAAAAVATPTATTTAAPCRMTRSRVNRRNTMDCAILNEMFIDDDSAKHNSDKRAKQLLRESERDMKRASMALVGPVAGLIEATNAHLHLEERAESMPVSSIVRNGATTNSIIASGTINSAVAAPLLVSFEFCSA